jgi:hypothetical protein
MRGIPMVDDKVKEKTEEELKKEVEELKKMVAKKLAIWAEAFPKNTNKDKS